MPGLENIHEHSLMEDLVSLVSNDHCARKLAAQAKCGWTCERSSRIEGCEKHCVAKDTEAFVQADV